MISGRVEAPLHAGVRIYSRSPPWSKSNANSRSPRGLGATESSLIRGFSTKQDTAQLVASTLIVMAHKGIRIFFYHVDSESNPSDGLSRA